MSSVQDMFLSLNNNFKKSPVILHFLREIRILELMSADGDHEHILILLVLRYRNMGGFKASMLNCYLNLRLVKINFQENLQLQYGKTLKLNTQTR